MGRPPGFVGFGAMPRRMAVRLRDASFAVSVFDPSHADGSVDGFALAASPAELARRVDAILACVPNDAALEQSMQGADGALVGMRPGQMPVNFSTVSPPASRTLAKAASDQGLRYVEAPMSGSTPEAESGQLVTLAGGTAADVAAADPVLDVLGRRTFHMAGLGDGLATKLVINGVMAGGTVALAEGLLYGTRAGVARDAQVAVLWDLILVSEHHKRKLAMAKAGRYPAQFPSRLMSKDMGLLLADARERHAPVPAMAVASQVYAFASGIHPDEDYAAAIAAVAGLSSG